MRRASCLLLALAGCGTPANQTCVPACAEGYVCMEGACVGGGLVDMAAPDGGGGGCNPACGGLTPKCNAGGHCVGCLTNTDCPSGKFCNIVSDTQATCALGCDSDDRCGGGKCCNKVCVDTNNDAANCGSCGKACGAPHSRAACANGQCAAGECDPGWGDCNGDGADGCEANLHADPDNCTACGMSCQGQLKNAITGCADGCYVQACKFGFDNCDDDDKNGCETPVLTDLNNCGGCGKPCKGLPNAMATCTSGNCVLGKCNQGFENCNGNPQDGCESNLNYDAMNCTACGVVCPMNTPNCVGGVCGQQDLSGVFAKFMSENRTVYIWKTPGQCVDLSKYTDFCTKRGLAWWKPKSQQDAQMLISFAFALDNTHTWIQVFGLATNVNGSVGGFNVMVDGVGCVESSPGGNQFGAFRKWACSFCNPVSNAMQMDNNQSCCWDKGHPYDWFVCEG